jgi:Fe(3+) dicitrate transport protein
MLDQKAAYGAFTADPSPENEQRLAVLADERLTAKIKAISYYAQNTFIMGDWTLTPGLRLEDVTSRKNLYSSATGAAFDTLESNLTTSKLQALPGLGWTWNGLNGTTVFGGIHRGFAPPRPDRRPPDGWQSDN